MMKYFTFFGLLLFTLCASAQIPSDCTIPSVLREAYERDVAGLAIERLQDQGGPNSELIKIPDIVTDSILAGMAAIFDLAGTLPEADSVFNRYCVHDNFGSLASFGFLVGVDTDSPIAQAWSEGNTLTGNAILDTLLTTYGFTLQNYFSFGAAAFTTDRYLNLFALADSITASVPGILYGEPDYLIGGAGQIHYSIDSEGHQFYDFSYEWNDCFDGCDNFYTWSFQVTPDCEVLFLGTNQGGVFGLEELPAPTDCMLTTGTENLIAYPRFQLFPNPATESLRWRAALAPEQGSWRIYNAQGQLLRQGDWSLQEIDLRTWNAGSYWLQAFDEQGQFLFQRAWVKQ